MLEINIKWLLKKNSEKVPFNYFYLVGTSAGVCLRR
jgi:hypothetical protein